MTKPGRSSRKISSSRRSCVASIFRSDIARVVESASKAAIPCKPPTRWAPRQVQIGPQALALSAHLNKELGISHERAARVLKVGYGMEVNRSALCRAMIRLGVKATPTSEELRIAVRRSQVNWMDETGWRVAGDLQM